MRALHRLQQLDLKKKTIQKLFPYPQDGEIFLSILCQHDNIYSYLHATSQRFLQHAERVKQNLCTRTVKRLTEKGTLEVKCLANALDSRADV